MARQRPTVEELRRSARQSLEQAGIDSAVIDSTILMRESFKWSAAELIVQGPNTPAQAGIDRFEAMLARRLQGEPVAYITGKKSFWSLEFNVTPDVLIPRPETEGVVECALTHLRAIKNPVIVDVGTGSGAILLSILSARTDATGFGLDISKRALEIAELNAKKFDLAERAKFLISDYLDGFNETVDLIVSNPPYITDQAMEDLPETVSRFEPGQALRGGPDGTSAYKAITSNAANLLKSGASIVFEIGYDQGAAVAAILQDAGFVKTRVDKDLAGHDRIVSGKLSA